MTPEELLEFAKNNMSNIYLHNMIYHIITYHNYYFKIK